MRHAAAPMQGDPAVTASRPATDVIRAAGQPTWRRFAGGDDAGLGDDASALATRIHRSSLAQIDDRHPAPAEPALLHPLPGPVTERWGAPIGSVVRRGTTGHAHWRTDGRWTAGTVCVDERSSGGMAAATEAAYRSVFAALTEAGTPHLLRLWNYLPRINAVDDGLERYRHFNVGRQRAFAAAGVGTAEGAPAACALGTEGGVPTVHFLAGTRPARTVENPRQVSAYRYPDAYGPVSPGFSRAALMALTAEHDMLLVSGTASIVGHATLHAGDVLRQAAETVTNLRAVVDAANRLSTRPVHRLEDLAATVYLRHADDLGVVRGELVRLVGAATPFVDSALWLRADVCRSDLAVEIEAQSRVSAC